MLTPTIASVRRCRSRKVAVITLRLVAVCLSVTVLVIGSQHLQLYEQSDGRQKADVVQEIKYSTNYDAAFLSFRAVGIGATIIGFVGCCKIAVKHGRSTHVKNNSIEQQRSSYIIGQCLVATTLVICGITLICCAETGARYTGNCPQHPSKQPQQQKEVTRLNIAESQFLQSDKDPIEIKPKRNPRHSAPLNATYAVPNNVFYIWCGEERQFEFRHYLGLLSVIHFMQPDNIMFYFDNAPAVDRHHYNTWLSELEDDYPFFLRSWDKSACDGKARPRQSFIRLKLCKNGGVYVGENVVIAKPLHEYRKNASAMSVFMDGSNILLMKMSAVGCPADNETIDVAEIPQNMRCVLKDKYIQMHGGASSGPLCVLIDKSTAPKDIWELDNSYGEFLRTVAYGKPDLARPVPDYFELIPNIGHVVWLGGGEMKLDFFICVLSLLHVAKVDVVYIHGEAPTGVYWQLIRDNPRVKIVRRTLRNIYRSKKAFVEGKAALLSDHCRVDILLRYGGIYVDTDVIVVQPLSRELRAYEAVANIDINTARRSAFPDTLSNGVMAAKPNSRFQRLFLDSMKSYDGSDYFSLGVRRPYKIKERHPDTIRLEPRLQVLCYESKCRPAWGPNYRDDNVNQFTNPDMLKDWKNATFAFHFTWPTPGEFQSMSLLLSATSMIGDIGRYVLEQAGMLEYFRNNRSLY